MKFISTEHVQYSGSLYKAQDPAGMLCGPCLQCALCLTDVCESVLCCVMREILFLELGCIMYSIIYIFLFFVRVIIFQLSYNWFICINSKYYWAAVHYNVFTQTASVQAETEAARGGSESRKIWFKTHLSKTLNWKTFFFTLLNCYPLLNMFSAECKKLWKKKSLFLL